MLVVLHNPVKQLTVSEPVFVQGWLRFHSIPRDAAMPPFSFYEACCRAGARVRIPRPGLPAETFGAEPFVATEASYLAIAADLGRRSASSCLGCWTCGTGPIRSDRM